MSPPFSFAFFKLVTLSEFELFVSSFHYLQIQSLSKWHSRRPCNIGTLPDLLALRSTVRITKNSIIGSMEENRWYRTEHGEPHGRIRRFSFIRNVIREQLLQPPYGIQLFTLETFDDDWKIF